MREFLRENWPWIALPLVVAGLMIAWILWNGARDDVAPHIYTIR